ECAVVRGAVRHAHRLRSANGSAERHHNRNRRRARVVARCRRRHLALRLAHGGDPMPFTPGFQLVEALDLLAMCANAEEEATPPIPPAPPGCTLIFDSPVF